jgi:hypothetical protein
MNAFRTACPYVELDLIESKDSTSADVEAYFTDLGGSEGGRTGSESSGGGANGNFQNPSGCTTDGVEPRQLDAVRWAFERSEM